MAIKTLNQFAVPKEPNTIYTSPPLSTWAWGTLKNQHTMTTHKSNILDHRKELLTIADQYTEKITKRKPAFEPNELIIATGHQPTWHHCGIFMKILLAHSLARHLNASFLHVVLDHVICNTDLAIPKKTRNGIFETTNFKINSCDTDSLLETTSFSSTIKKSFIQSTIEYSPQNALCKTSWDNFNQTHHSATDCITSLLSPLYTNLGIDVLYLPVSKLSESKAFQDYVTSLLIDFETFTDCYNSAIQKADINNGISILGRKTISSNQFREFPLWVLTPERTQSTLLLSLDCDDTLILSTNTGTILHVGQKDTHTVFEKLKRKGYALRPKAILLTLFIRLYLSDWFIHGVGGSLYETINNFLLVDYFGINGLSYGVATFTSYLFGNDFVELKQYSDYLHEQYRSFRYNPETLMNHISNPSPKFQTLLTDKQKEISISKDQTQSSESRKKARNKIKDINQKLQHLLPLSEESILNEINTLKQSLKVCGNREYFWGLFPREYFESFLKVINEQLK